MKFHSLRLRLMGLAALWVVGSLTAAAWVLHLLFVTNLEREVEQDLKAAMTRVIALMDLDAPASALTAPLPDPRYDTPLGGRYWQIMPLDGGATTRSRSLWDMTIPTDRMADGLHHISDGAGWHLIFVTRTVVIDGQALQVTTGEDHDPIHAAGLTFIVDVIRLFSLLGLLILAAAWLQLRLGLAPLNRLRAEIDRIRRGGKARLDVVFPDELEPLVGEVNALLDERDANMERARQRASDLAHGLKTPLAALHGIATRVRDKGDPADADIIDDLAFEMSQRVDYQMRLSAVRLRSGGHHESAALTAAVLRTIAVLKRTGRGEALHWVADLPEDCLVDIHRQDLMELVGVLLENAAFWATTRVVVHTRRAKDRIILEILDDGPGIPREHLAQLGQRGERLDQSTPGTGLGLAIAKEIVSLNAGELQFRVGDAGGLTVAVTLNLAPS